MKNFTPELIEEMRVALINAVEALRATEVFMCGQRLDTKDLNKIISSIDNLLDRLKKARIFEGSGMKKIAPGLIGEMCVALINAVEALRATEIFMCGQGLETDDLNKIVRTIDELLDRVDEAQEF